MTNCSKRLRMPSSRSRMQYRKLIFLTVEMQALKVEVVQSLMEKMLEKTTYSPRFLEKALEKKSYKLQVLKDLVQEITTRSIDIPDGGHSDCEVGQGMHGGTVWL